MVARATSAPTMIEMAWSMPDMLSKPKYVGSTLDDAFMAFWINLERIPLIIADETIATPAPSKTFLAKFDSNHEPIAKSNAGMLPPHS